MLPPPPVLLIISHPHSDIRQHPIILLLKHLLIRLDSLLQPQYPMLAFFPVAIGRVLRVRQQEDAVLHQGLPHQPRRFEMVEVHVRG